MSLPTIEQAVLSLYRNVSEDSSFERNLALMAGWFRSHVVAMHEEDVLIGRGSARLFGALAPSELADFTSEYARRWSAENPWIQRCTPGMLSKGFEATHDVLTDREVIDSEYYRRYLKRLDVRFGVGIALMKHGNDQLSMLAVNRAEAEGALSAEELHFIRQIHPHLETSYSLARRLHQLQDEARLHRATLERMPFGVLTLDVEGRVLWLNGSASNLLVGGSTCKLRLGKIRLADPKQQQWLESSLRQLHASSLAQPPRSGIAGTTASGKPLALHLHLLPADLALDLPGRVTAFLVDLDARQSGQLCVRALMGVLGFTAMEASSALAMHACGDIEKAAENLRISSATLRFHIKNCFKKARTRKQAELTRMVERVIGTIPRA